MRVSLDAAIDPKLLAQRDDDICALATAVAMTAATANGAIGPRTVSMLIALLFLTSLETVPPPLPINAVVLVQSVWGLRSMSSIPTCRWGTPSVLYFDGCSSKLDYWKQRVWRLVPFLFDSTLGDASSSGESI